MFRYVLAFTVLAACFNSNEATTPGSQADTNRFVALCGGGFSSKDKATLEAIYERNSGQSGKIGVGTEREFESTILTSEDITEANKVEAYNAFIGCLREAGAFA